MVLKVEFLMSLSSVAPPPLTPPHKGEGDDFVSVAAGNVEDRDWAVVPQNPPPPCGEGLGVGVLPYAIARPMRGQLPADQAGVKRTALGDQNQSKNGSLK